MRRLNLRKRVLLAFWAISLIPLFLLTINSSRSLENVEVLLRHNAESALDAQAAHALKLRAISVSSQVSQLLNTASADLKALALIPPEPSRYLEFANLHRSMVWYRAGSNERPSEVRVNLPLYEELAFIAADGREQLRIINGQLTSELRDVSNPANTTYLNEDYFSKARHLPYDAIYVSHLTGWHVSRQEQLQGAPDPESAVSGERYRGVLRFAMPVRDGQGQLQGVVVLSLDHRHLMELTQHITPTEEDFTVFPSYNSGNYAFMFDDEGWMLTHPKYWDIRGLDRHGRLLPAYSQNSTAEDIRKGAIPFNLLQARFVHPNYPAVAREVLAGRAGVVDVTNVGGLRKIMAYAPIAFSEGDYGLRGIFGGITIGAEVRQFHKAAATTSQSIGREISRFASGSAVVIFLTGIIVFFVALRMSGEIAEPLRDLIDATKRMARGRMVSELTVTSGDEIGELSTSFNHMARELNERRSRLLRSLQELRRSRLQIMRERNFKEAIFEHVEMGILTLDADAHLTSLNGPAQRLLGLTAAVAGMSLADALVEWPELLAVVEVDGLASENAVWSRYVESEREALHRTYRVATLPLDAGGSRGWLLTIEDLTERVELRRQMERVDRLASLGRLSAGIAHEIRNPLTGVSLLLDELHDRLLGRNDDQGLIQRALTEIERLEGLVGELLRFSAWPASNRQPDSIVEVMRDTLFLLRKQCENSHVALIESYDEELPLVLVDRDKLKQAFLNLCNNALDAMPQGGELRIAVEREGRAVKVSVADNGEGMRPEQLAMIFEPFYTTKGGGTGLGLAITHNIVSDHGGRIVVDSRPDQGTDFHLFFPVLDELPAGR